MFVLLLLLLFLPLFFSTSHTVAVHCKDTRIAVQVRTNKPFNGRIYALGRSETCNIDVVNSDAFRLDLTMGGQDCNTQSIVSYLLFFFLSFGLAKPPLHWIQLIFLFRCLSRFSFIHSFRPVSIRIRLCCNITALLWQKPIKSTKSSARMTWARRILHSVCDDSLNRHLEFRINFWLIQRWFLLDFVTGMMPIRDPEMIHINSSPEAPPPRIRILDTRSREVETVRIGDRLTFRIEIPEDSKSFALQIALLSSSCQSNLSGFSSINRFLHSHLLSTRCSTIWYLCTFMCGNGQRLEEHIPNYWRRRMPGWSNHFPWIHTRSKCIAIRLRSIPFHWKLRRYIPM